MKIAHELSSGQAQRPARNMARAVSAGLVVALHLVLVSCSSMDNVVDLPKRNGVTDPIRDADLRARAPERTDSRFNSVVQKYLRPLIYPAADTDPPAAQTPGADPSDSVNAGGAAIGGTPAPGVTNTTAGIEINFENANIQTVAKTLIADTLGLNFAVDTRVQGTVTLASAAPVPRKDLLAVFESVLRMSNAGLVRDKNLIRIVPLPETAGSGKVTMLGSGEAGFGVTIVPLRYVSATTVSKTAENFMARPGAIRVDQARNVILVQGTSAERQTAIDMISTFDVEWLHDQSVGIYPLKSTSAETLIKELERVFDSGENGLGQGAIKFQPISRMNAVLAVARSPKMIERVTQWVQRLDRSDTGGTTVRVYHLKNGSAQRLAKVLNDIFVGRGGAGTSGDTAASQIAPGQNASQSRLDSLNTGSSFQQQGSSGSSSTTTTTSSSSSNSGGLSRPTQGGDFDSFGGDKDGGPDGGGGGGGALPRGVFTNVRITANLADNSLVVYSTQEDYRVIERSIRELDRPQMQVAIDATIAEVTLTDNFQFGIQSFLTSKNVGLGTNKGSSLYTPSATAGGSTTSTDPTTGLQTVVQQAFLQRVLPGYNLLLGSEAQPTVILNALSKLTDVKVLSAPSLVVMDNQPALLQVGNEIPLSTGSATVLTGSNTIVNTIERRNIGVILKVWPRVRANGAIQLEIEQEISNVANPNDPTNALTPTLTQRRVRSTIAIQSGQTVLLGGLISEQTSDTSTGLPGLREIKYLGDLLGNTARDKQRQEIIIFVRPRLIRNSVDAESVAEEFRDRLETMRSTRAIVGGTAAVLPPKTR
ncbi:type II secretion system secretin GspD [Rhodoplanes sp. Z2-YC6860]|uniref:type II secretion system secretin GspD n=1 Tax=Rhodoplanes sp. Z2-YC6860 TaxID=674703 RepID=UPI00078CB13E|nr:type II secretion system secretin GspD [Rhodoplanes sp. Z2-YC6860]AMN40705.1 general secretion pathway protein D GspD [Rhodoplanes sp. Z2-YC6860]